MARIGEVFGPGKAAPVAGTYQCTGAGCTSAFKATIEGVPLPPPHHPGAAWRLTATERTTTPEPKSPPRRP